MDRKEAIELIKRHMIIHQIGKYPHIKLGEALSLAIKALQEPERKKGQWVNLTCTECGQFDFTKPDYCPSCGADMRGEEE